MKIYISGGFSVLNNAKTSKNLINTIAREKPIGWVISYYYRTLIDKSKIYKFCKK